MIVELSGPNMDLAEDKQFTDRDYRYGCYYPGHSRNRLSESTKQKLAGIQ